MGGRLLDKSLGQSEDVELGVRLRRPGCAFVFASDAYVLHGSDHVSFERWPGRAHRYGMFDTVVARKHPTRGVNPWRLLFETNPARASAARRDGGGVSRPRACSPAR